MPCGDLTKFGAKQTSAERGKCIDITRRKEPSLRHLPGRGGQAARVEQLAHGERSFVGAAHEHDAVSHHALNHRRKIWIMRAPQQERVDPRIFHR